MSTVDHLVANHTALELAKSLMQIAKENVRLLDAVGALQHEVFWLRAAEDKQIALLRMQLLLAELHLAQARDPYAGMFQDAEGKIPVTALGQPVGWIEACMHGTPFRYACEECDPKPAGPRNEDDDTPCPF